MRRLRHARERIVSRTNGEDGAVIIFIAIALVALLAMTAFVIDFGRVWEERRELQNGATAGAFAVGEDCARDLCLAGYDEAVVAELYADANAVDGAAAVDWVDLDLVGQTVQVATSTENASGGNSIGMMFAGILGFDEMTVGADATVAWGTPLRATGLPLIFSDCEWMRTDPGWPGENPEALPWPTDDLSLFPSATIVFQDPQSGGTDCTTHPGLDLPGGWGWLEPTSGCATEGTLGDWLDASTGNPPPNPCSASYFQSLLGEVVLIPYYSALNGTGANIEYQLAGVAPFVLTGYRFPKAGSAYDPNYVSGPPCGSPNTCIGGYFVQYADNGGGGDLGGEDRGFTVIKLIG